MQVVCEVAASLLLLLAVLTRLQPAICRITTQQDESNCLRSCWKNPVLDGRRSQDVSCDSECKRYQCDRGCEGWKLALNSSCQHFCISGALASSSRAVIGNYYCVVGCRNAVHNFTAQLNETVRAIHPELVANSASNVSMLIRWTLAEYLPQFVDVLPRVAQLLQYKRRDSSSQWTLWPANASAVQTFHVFNLTSLTPYTSYLFRVVCVVPMLASTPLYSSVLGPHSTLTGDSPSSPVRQLTATPTGPRHVTISWRAPLVPAGPIVSYWISMTPVGGETVYGEVIDDSLVYRFQTASPNTTYTITVSVFTRQGESEVQVTEVTTPPLPESELVVPYLIVVSGDVVIKMLAHLFTTPQTIFASRPDEFIRGSAVDVAGERVFLSTSAGRLLALHHVNHHWQSRDLTSTWSLTGQPSQLTFDWLTECLYALVHTTSGSPSWHIDKLCMSTQPSAVLPLIMRFRPSHIEIDPIHGYFYFSYGPNLPDCNKSMGQAAGLYRTSIDNFDAVETITEAAGVSFKTFHVELDNSSVLLASVGSPASYSHEGGNDTVFSLSMFDWSVANIRLKSVRRRYSLMITVTEYNNTLFWSDGQHVFMGSHNHPTDTYYTNQFLLLRATRPISQVHLWHSLAQPVPAPTAPPANVQVVGAERHALVSWRPPASSQLAGPAAWHNWTYNVNISMVGSGGDDDGRFISCHCLSVTVDQLQPATSYHVSVRAVSRVGAGIWSRPIEFSTLQQTVNTTVSIVWFTHTALLQSDAIGHHVDVVSHFASAPSSAGRDMGQGHVIDMTWLHDLLFVSLSNGRVHVFNLTSRSWTRLEDEVRATAMSVDWRGSQLVWIDPIDNSIHIASLSVSPAGENVSSSRIILLNSRVLHGSVAAVSVSVDSDNGVLYWTSSFSVSVSYLSGASSSGIYTCGIFSGKQVGSVVVNSAVGRVFWVVREIDQFAVFSRTLSSDLNDISVTLWQSSGNHGGSVTLSSHQHILGRLWTLQDRLLWLNRPGQVTVADPTLTRLTSLNVTAPSAPLALAVVDPWSRPGSHKVDSDSYVPRSVDARSVRLTAVKGEAENGDDVINSLWMLSWQPVTSAASVRVGYIVKVNNITQPVTYSPSLDVVMSLAAYSLIQVSVACFTRWAVCPAVQVALRTPHALPSPATNVRVFSHRTWPLTANQSWTGIVRWSEPTYPRGQMYMYQVMVRRTDVGYNQLIFSDSVPADVHQVTLTSLLTSHQYQVKVRAVNSAGASIQWSSLQFQPGAASAPAMQRLLAFTVHGSLLLIDPDTRLVTDLVSRDVVDLAVDAHADQAYVLTSDSHIRKLHLHSLHERTVCVLDGIGGSVAYDWLSGVLYWSQREASGHHSSIFFMHTRAMYNHARASYRKTLLFSATSIITALSVDPLHNRIVWKTGGSDGHRVYAGQIHKFASGSYTPHLLPVHKSRCGCEAGWQQGVMLTTNSSKQRVIMRQGTRIVSSSLDKCSCHLLAKLPTKTGEVAVSSDSLFWFDEKSVSSSDASLIIFRKPLLSSVRHYSSLLSSQQVSINNYFNNTNNNARRGFLSRLWVIDPSLQALPSSDLCLLPPPVSNLSVLHVTSTTIKLHVEVARDKDQWTDAGCASVSVSRLLWYSVHFSRASQHDLCNQHTMSRCVNRTVAGPTEINLSDLSADTSYTVMISAVNWFTRVMSVKQPVSLPITVTTAAPPPSPAEDVSAEPSSSHSVIVSWTCAASRGGSGAVQYSVHWAGGGASGGRMASSAPRFVHSSTSNNTNTHCSHEIDSLKADTNYSVSVVSINEASGQKTRSEAVFVSTFSNPGVITLQRVNMSSLLVSWSPTNQAGVNRSEVQYIAAARAETGAAWLSCEPASADNISQEHSSYCWARGLNTASSYVFRYQLFYSNGHTSVWPRDQRFTFSTTGGPPSRPSSPRVRNLVAAGLVQLVWSLSAGVSASVAAIDQYKLQAARSLRSPAVKQQYWSTVYNGTETSWLVNVDVERVCERGEWCVFRVCSHNKHGWSKCSEPSAPLFINGSLSLPDVVSSASSSALSDTTSTASAAAVASAVLVVLLTGAAALIIYVRYRGVGVKKSCGDVGGAVAAVTSSSSDGGGCDSLSRGLELAQLRDLPANLVHRHNTLYSSRVSVSACGGLPHVRRDSLTLTKFLGRGAFGEVYEGFAQQLPQHEARGDSWRVAVKTLTKGASHEDKMAFLKEARVMSNFKHEHIVSFLGVCIDCDPFLLLLELMEDGDLLSYLRTNRGVSSDGCAAMSLVDQLQACVDVARGCQYLEQLHFVHRDLAARNCLVTTKISGRKLLVKIGDFGLARDIYKNDYYRKEGEGLLPVRWMAPESLVDGVFTSQSDVWSFGVLMWEVLTLGQQPYPARSNLDVLRLVRDGGTIEQPPSCPPPLYSLMQCCWHYEPEQRVTFSRCVLCLHSLLTAATSNTVDGSMCVHNQHYDNTDTRAELMRSGEHDVSDHTSLLAHKTAASDVTSEVTSEVTSGHVTSEHIARDRSRGDANRADVCFHHYLNTAAYGGGDGGYNGVCGEISSVLSPSSRETAPHNVCFVFDSS